MQRRPRARLRDLLLGVFWLVGVPVLGGTAAAVLAGWVTPPGTGGAQVLPVGATTGTHRAPAIDDHPASTLRDACASCPSVLPRPTLTAFVDVHPWTPATPRPDAADPSTGPTGRG